MDTCLMAIGLLQTRRHCKNAEAEASKDCTFKEALN